MIENEICCYIKGFLKWNISKKTSYIVGNKNFPGKICILSLRNKRKSIFARVKEDCTGNRQDYNYGILVKKLVTL